QDYSIEHHIPVYIGVGLRIQATVVVLTKEVNLTGLYAIGLAAAENRVAGSLTIQTLGISGEAISTAIPFPDQVNLSTIQAAMQAMATIKSKLYDPTTTAKPQIMGFDSPYGMPGARELLTATVCSFPPEGTAAGSQLTFRFP